LDIDNFREYNELYGQKEGDSIIKRVGNSLRSLSKDREIFCFRIGGDEFAVIQLSKNRDEIYNFIESVRERIEALQIKHKRSSTSKYLTLSAGVSIKGYDERFSEESIYREADSLLSIAKESGKNRVQREE
jgi:diguanylate cyclase (GGDEF)-like protein